MGRGQSDDADEGEQGAPDRWNDRGHQHGDGPDGQDPRGRLAGTGATLLHAVDGQRREQESDTAAGGDHRLRNGTRIKMTGGNQEEEGVASRLDDAGAKRAPPFAAKGELGFVGSFHVWSSMRGGWGRRETSKLGAMQAGEEHAEGKGGFPQGRGGAGRTAWNPDEGVVCCGRAPCQRFPACNRRKASTRSKAVPRGRPESCRSRRPCSGNGPAATCSG